MVALRFRLTLALESVLFITGMAADMYLGSLLNPCCLLWNYQSAQDDWTWSGQVQSWTGISQSDSHHEKQRMISVRLSSFNPNLSCSWISVRLSEILKIGSCPSQLSGFCPRNPIMPVETTSSQHPQSGFLFKIADHHFLTMDSSRS